MARWIGDARAAEDDELMSSFNNFDNHDDLPLPEQVDALPPTDDEERVVRPWPKTMALRKLFSGLPPTIKSVRLIVRPEVTREEDLMEAFATHLRGDDDNGIILAEAEEFGTLR
ncbi:hypothetical protein BD626DRAFT_537626 [Schizophyllum amplum]|uniref:Uncharacterized protein n=1 Tax=Schizophyllum amplum TaxID=97359 RepID=A0A550CBW5_9AGAR|nr:hypothetical protein BD626DRAFT_537626 [Auriculariopsis ampla]